MNILFQSDDPREVLADAKRRRAQGESVTVTPGVDKLYAVCAHPVPTLWGTASWQAYIRFREQLRAAGVQ